RDQRRNRPHLSGSHGDQDRQLLKEAVVWRRRNLAGERTAAATALRPRRGVGGNEAGGTGAERDSGDPAAALIARIAVLRRPALADPQPRLGSQIATSAHLTAKRRRSLGAPIVLLVGKIKDRGSGWPEAASRIARVWRHRKGVACVVQAGSWAREPRPKRQRLQTPRLCGNAS